MIEVAHQCRAGLAVGHVPRRTAHVDVDHLRALAGREARAFGHPVGLAARELDDMGGVARRFQPQLGVALAGGERRAGRHLGYDEARP